MRDVWEAISDKTRREILAMLKKGKLSAGEIAERFRRQRRPFRITFLYSAARGW